MTEESGDVTPVEAPLNRRLAILLAMAMFVLVVDTSLMNVSIAAVVQDLDTTVSGVQSAIALEALVSAAFILIGSKVGDLIGRKKAYVLGLLGYAVGATGDDPGPGFDRDHHLLGRRRRARRVPAVAGHAVPDPRQLPRRGAEEGLRPGRRRRRDRRRVGPLLGGFITTFLSWRVGFLLEVVVIAVVLSGIKLVHDVPYTGPREVDIVGAILSVLGMGGIVLGILVWQEGGEAVGVLLAVGAVAMAGFGYWLVRRKRQRKAALIDPDLFRSKVFRLGITEQMLQQIALGGTMIALPIYLQMVLEYNAMQAGLSLAPLSLTMFGVALLAGKRAGKRRPAGIIRVGFLLLTAGLVVLIPIVPRADSGWYLLVPLVIAGSGLGLLVSQLNNYTLAPISEERVSEAAGVNSAAGSFGLSFGLAFAGAIMLASLSFAFTSMAESSTVLAPAEQQQVATALEDDAEVMSNTQLEEQLVGQPADNQGRDHPDQHRGPAVGPADRPAHPDPRRADRTVQLVPDDAATGPQTVRLRRGHGPGLTTQGRLVTTVADRESAADGSVVRG